MKTIERLIRKYATDKGTWEGTHYLSLKQAREANPGEYASSFRIATGEPVRVNLIAAYPTIHKTRFPELGYANFHTFWQVVDLTGDSPAQVGTQYATKAELLANLESYATEYGCDGANPKPSSRPLTDAETATVLCALRNHEVNPEWHGVEPQDRLTSEQIDALCDTIATNGAVTIQGSPIPTPVNDSYEKALREIANTYPDPDCAAPLVSSYIGPNEGQSRATLLWFALNTARKALGLATYPKPEHWS